MQSKRARGDKSVRTEEMRDLDKALADIIAIRSQLAAGTAFARLWSGGDCRDRGRRADHRGRCNISCSTTPLHHPLSFLFGWALAALLVGRDDPDRDAGALAPASFGSRRRHDPPGGRAVPAGSAVAGALLAVMLWKFAPESLWLLPGLWQVLVSLGVFASVRSLPRTVALARRLVLRRGLRGAAARKPEPRAVALDHGPAVRRSASR